MQISRDCQELDPFVGPQLATLLYDEPDSELWVSFLLFFSLPAYMMLFLILC